MSTEEENTIDNLQKKINSISIRLNKAYETYVLHVYPIIKEFVEQNLQNIYGILYPYLPITHKEYTNGINAYYECIYYHYLFHYNTQYKELYLDMISHYHKFLLHIVDINDLFEYNLKFYGRTLAASMKQDYLYNSSDLFDYFCYFNWCAFDDKYYHINKSSLNEISSKYGVLYIHAQYNNYYYTYIDCKQYHNIHEESAKNLNENYINEYNSLLSPIDKETYKDMYKINNYSKNKFLIVIEYTSDIFTVTKNKIQNSINYNTIYYSKEELDQILQQKIRQSNIFNIDLYNSISEKMLFDYSKRLKQKYNHKIDVSKTIYYKIAPLFSTKNTLEKNISNITSYLRTNYSEVISFQFEILCLNLLETIGASNITFNILYQQIESVLNNYNILYCK